MDTPSNPAQLYQISRRLNLPFRSAKLPAAAKRVSLMSSTRTGMDFLFRPGRPGLGTLLVAIWAGFMVATAGAAVYPPVTAIVTPLVCSGGEAQVDSRTFSTRPGETIVTREFNCIGDSGKPESVMFKTLAATFAAYALIAFVLLTLLGLWRGRKGAAPGPLSAPASAPAPADAFATLDAAVSRADLRDAIFRSQRAAAGASGVEARLEVLNGLREAGLISDADYEAKKAEILSRL